MNRLTFLKNILALGGSALLPIGLVKNYRKFYLLQCFVAGFRFYKGMELLDQMQEGDMLELVREPDNAYDEAAIALHWNGEKIGFIPKSENEFLSKLLDAEALELMAEIAHLNKEVKPWENLHVGVYFLKNWEGDLPKDKEYLAELRSPRYRTLKRTENLITRINRGEGSQSKSESDWYAFLTRNADNDNIYDLIHNSNLDPNYRYGAETGDYLLINKLLLDIDDFTDSISGHVDELYTHITEYANELEGLFGENGYVVLSTQEAENLVNRIVKLVEVTDKLGNRYIEMVLG
jgi:hypothetical protein